MKVLVSSRALWSISKAADSIMPITTALIKPQRIRVCRNYCAAKEQATRNKQNLLPFPAIPLEESLQRFLASTQPLLSEEEFKKQQEITENFAKEEGKELQALLVEESKKSSNWLAPRWLNVAYLQFRKPLTVYSSPGMTFPLQEFQSLAEYALYTAKVIYGLCEFKQLVDANKIPVVKMGKFELDNSQFGKVLGTCRLPKRMMDSLVYNPDSDYAVIIHKNHFYKMSILSNKCLIKAEFIAKEIEKIINSEPAFGPEYGLLTTDTRDNWAEAYEHVIKLPGNEKSIKTIQNAMFTVSLDQCLNVDICERDNVLAAQLIHGGGAKQNSANRWMDKTIQLIANPNGMIGFTYEHSPAEGQPIAMIVDYVVKRMTTDNDFGNKGETEGFKAAEKLPLAPLNQCIETWLQTARFNVGRLAENLELSVLKFDDYGKKFIKNAKLGPDSYVQMAIQLAFYMLHGVPGAQYESAHLRMFDGGRTENIRSCSMESVEFCKAMMDNKCNDDRRVQLLKAAVNGHQAYTKLALQGRGCDRHLLGLKLMAIENCLPIPKFYTSPGYVKSQYFHVTTSQVASIYDAFMAYGPDVADGYGCCYNPRECDIIFAASAWHDNQATSAKKFTEHLRKALNSMKALLDADNEKQTSKL